MGLLTAAWQLGLCGGATAAPAVTGGTAAGTGPCYSELAIMFETHDHAAIARQSALQKRTLNLPCKGVSVQGAQEQQADGQQAQSHD